jgi:N-acetylmuramoyl-L-alanine amidase
MSWSILGALLFVALAIAFVCRRRAANRAAAFVAAPPLVDHPSPNFGDRNVPAPTFLILHYTAMNSAQEALDRLCDPVAKVSSHYLVGEDGTIYRLVAEDKSAWHAGASFWDGTANLNGRSIGIEIDNPGDRPFAQAQMAAVAALCRWILSRYNIKAQNVIGHADVAPGRKPDPGWFFDWKGLAAQGIGVWPTPTAADYERTAGWGEAEMRRALSQLGYTRDVEFAKVMETFQRHWRQEVASDPAKIGKVDKESAARISCLLRMKR